MWSSASHKDYGQDLNASPAGHICRASISPLSPCPSYHATAHPCIYASLHPHLHIHTSMHLCFYASMFPCRYESMHLCLHVSMLSDGLSRYKRDKGQKGQKKRPSVARLRRPFDDLVRSRCFSYLSDRWTGRSHKKGLHKKYTPKRITRQAASFFSPPLAR